MGMGHLTRCLSLARALADEGLLSVKEPFTGLFTQGMVTHETYRRQTGEWVEPGDVEITAEGATRRALAHLDHPGVLQGPQRLAQGVAAHVQSLCQVALGRQAVARLDLAAGDELPDLPRYLVGGTGRSNGSEGGSRRVQGKQSCPSILASRGR